MIFRYDFVLSIWIFTWFLLYFFKITNHSPIFILLVASIIDTIAIFYKIYYKENFSSIFKFFIIQCIIKYIPLYLVWTNFNDAIKSTNIFSSVVFVFLHLLYMYINLGSFREMIAIYDRMLKTTTSKTSEDQYPLTALWNKLEKDLYLKKSGK